LIALQTTVKADIILSNMCIKRSYLTSLQQDFLNVYKVKKIVVKFVWLRKFLKVYSEAVGHKASKT